MSENNGNSKPLPRIELLGATPPDGQRFCALCCMFYLGAVSDDPKVQEALQERTAEAMKHGRDVVMLNLPPRRDKVLRLAVTDGLSTYFPDLVMPVCWVHMIPYGKVRNAAPVGVSYQVGASPLIPGKKGDTR